jgi:hypothetical protein
MTPSSSTRQNISLCFFLFWHIEHGIALGWVGEEEEKRGRNVLDAQIDGGCLVVPPNSPFSYEGGRPRASENRCSGF